MANNHVPQIEMNLYELYLHVANSIMFLKSEDQDTIFKILAQRLQEQHNISKADIRRMNKTFDIEDSDDEDEDEEEDKYHCCCCQDELFFGHATNCIGMCKECHQEICEAHDCSKISEDDELYCLTCWKIKEEDGEPEIGACGFRCDGHCQTCDPGYPHGGGYDGADEI